MTKIYKYFLVLMLTGAIHVGSLSAQTFTVSPTNNYTLTVEENGYKDGDVDLINNTQDTLYLEWTLISNNLDTNWIRTLCDYGGCWSSTFPNGRVMDAVPPGGKGFFKLTIGPKTFMSSGKQLVLEVWDVDNPSMKETVTYTVDVVVDVEKDQLSRLVSIYPNPAVDHFSVRNDHKESGMLSIIDLQGKVVFTTLIDAASISRVDVSDLDAGMYMAQFRSGEAVTTKKLILW